MSYESTVALEHLDGLLKTILRVKLREFVHLSPCFRDIPSIDAEAYPRLELPDYAPVPGFGGPCPNRSGRPVSRRRYTRKVLV